MKKRDFEHLKLNNYVETLKRDTMPIRSLYLTFCLPTSIDLSPART